MKTKNQDFENLLTNAEVMIKEDKFPTESFTDIEKEYGKYCKNEESNDLIKKKFHQLRKKVYSNKTSWDLMKEDIESHKEVQQFKSFIDKIEQALTTTTTKKTIKELQKELKTLIKDCDSSIDKFFIHHIENECMKKLRLLERHVNNRTTNKTKYKVNSKKEQTTNNKKSTETKKSKDKKETPEKEITNTIKKEITNNKTKKKTSEFGAWLKRTRLTKKMTLKELENSSGVSSGYIHQIESGYTQNPSVKIVEKLAKGLEVNTEEVLQNLNMITPSTIDYTKNASQNLFDMIYENNISVNGLDLNEDQKSALIGCLHYMFDESKDVTSISRFLNQASSLKA